jgi:hypothetical protein
MVEQAAEIIGCRLHIINVSRISPLELEGVQMPVPDTDKDLQLKLLTATYWSALKEGDILLFDEFLRGFPEVYNGLLDIITSRQVGGYILPRVFIIAASNSTVSYDKALEDRLLHLPVPDPRKGKATKAMLAQLLVEKLGLMPVMVGSTEMQTLLDTEVLPMYDVLDSLKNKTSAPGSTKGSSLRHLIGQAQLRQVQSTALKELISVNNIQAAQDNKFQFIFLMSGRDAVAWPRYETEARGLLKSPRLTDVQRLNIQLNLQLIEMETIRNEKGEPQDDHSDDDPF